MFDKGPGFKIAFVTLIHNFSIQIVCTIVNNSQENTSVEQVNQVIYNMLVTKDLRNKVFDYIYTWG